MRTYVRISLLAGISVPILYFGAQALAAPFFPGFSILTHSASQLGSDLSSHPEILNGGAALTGAAGLVASLGLFTALRDQRVWALLAALVAACSVSTGLASLWAATHPMPDPNHNPGALGAGMFAAPFLVLLASFRLAQSSALRWFLTINALAFCVVASLYAGLIPVDLGLYGGAVQRVGALIMLLPVSALSLFLLRTARSEESLDRKMLPQVAKVTGLEHDVRSPIQPFGGMARGNPQALRAVKIVHTLAWAIFAGCIVALPLAAYLKNFKLAALLIAVVLVEVMILFANNFRCPLTDVAARYTTDRSANFDIYLPLWIARYNKEIFGSFFVAGILFTLVLWQLT